MSMDWVNSDTSTRKCFLEMKAGATFTIFVSINNKFHQEVEIQQAC